MQAYNNNQ
jgi:NIMA (never in mitosis gene a)-related kinase 1/4/5